jgi:translation initiation factor IF-3
MDEQVRINDAIRVPEVRVIGKDGENLGILPTREAIRLAKEANLDLVEASARAIPPVCRITDYGKYMYELAKKNKEVKAKSHITETKTVQVKIGTGEHDMELKAAKTAEWLKERHRVKVDLFLSGRYKYMPFDFLKSRLERFLATIPESFKIAEPITKSPKGLSVALEHDKSGAKPDFSEMSKMVDPRALDEGPKPMQRRR